MVVYERGKVPKPTPEEEAMMSAHAHEEPDLSDAPEWTDEDCAQAVRPYAFDPEVMAWLRTHQHGYANSVLRDAMLRETQNASQAPTAYP